MKNIKLVILVMVFLALCLWGDKVLASDFKLVPPTTNEDDTALIDLAGYKFYCGNAKGNYTLNKDAGMLYPGTDGICYYDIGNIIPQDGIWFCVATAYNMSGKESKYSNEIFFTVSGGSISTVAPSTPGLSFRP